MKIPKNSGFSLIEALATVAIIGIITFLALPNVISARRDAEVSMAVSRAEAINMAVASLVQSRGFTSAKSDWDGAASEEIRYAQLRNYLAYAPTNLTDFAPDGYSISLPVVLSRPLDKVTLNRIDGETIAAVAY